MRTKITSDVLTKKEGKICISHLKKKKKNLKGIKLKSTTVGNLKTARWWGTVSAPGSYFSQQRRSTYSRSCPPISLTVRNKARGKINSVLRFYSVSQILCSECHPILKMRKVRSHSQNTDYEKPEPRQTSGLHMEGRARPGTVYIPIIDQNHHVGMFCAEQISPSGGRPPRRCCVCRLWSGSESRSGSPCP